MDCHLVFYTLAQVDSEDPDYESPSDHRILLFRDFRQNFEASRTRYFVLTRNLTGARKMGLFESQESLDPLVDWPGYFFVRGPEHFARSDSVSRGILEACGLPPVELDVARLTHLPLKSSELLRALGGKTALVVGFKGCSGKFPARHPSLRNLTRPARCIFQPVCLVAPPERLVSATRLRADTLDYVVCAFGPDSYCLLKDPFRAEVLKNVYSRSNPDQLRDKVETLEVGAGGSNLFAQGRAETQQKKSAKVRHRKRKQRCDKIRKTCPCPTCRDSTDYDDNMSRGGPEQLLTHKLTLTHLLSLLGMDDPENLGILEELSRLSVAAFDIESMTVKLDHAPPDGVLPLADIDSASQSQHFLALQKPIMLAHRDGLMSDDEDCPVFVLESDEEGGVYQMLRDYWKFVVDRRERCYRAKLELAAPLLASLKEYETVFLKYAADWVDPTAPTPADSVKLEDREKISGWRTSLPGRAETQLQQLIERYEIFSFYGAGYDHVLLQNYLVPYLFEKRLRPRLEKSGNKITAIKVVKHRITFRDVVRLLAPGTSLRQFGQLFKLEQAKAHFPFALLTGLESLGLPRLPASAADWHSDLSSSRGPITQAEVDEAQHLFDASSCLSVGDYLRTYLRLDVDILYRATQGWRQTIASEIKVDFVQAAAFTISSISNYAGDVNSSGNLHIGQFFPNSASVYRMLRKGMRG